MITGLHSCNLPFIQDWPLFRGGGGDYSGVSQYLSATKRPVLVWIRTNKTHNLALCSSLVNKCFLSSYIKDVLLSIALISIGREFNSVVAL